MPRVFQVLPSIAGAAHPVRPSSRSRAGTRPVRTKASSTGVANQSARQQIGTLSTLIAALFIAFATSHFHAAEN
jgi:hypothetical protein